VAEDCDPVKLSVAGPGMPRYEGGGIGIVWLIPAAVVVTTSLAILCGALWR
jgi:hypothetical protein